MATRAARDSGFLICAILTLCALLLGGEGKNFPGGAEKKFKIFMESYGKNYSSREEYFHRLGIFARNIVRAAEHQALDPTAVHGVTPFSDLSPEEFDRFYTGVKGGSAGIGGEAPPLEVEGLPENFDWREKGAVTEVKMQVIMKPLFAYLRRVKMHFWSRKFCSVFNLVS